MRLVAWNIHFILHILSNIAYFIHGQTLAACTPLTQAVEEVEDRRKGGVPRQVLLKVN